MSSSTHSKKRRRDESSSSSSSSSSKPAFKAVEGVPTLKLDAAHDDDVELVLIQIPSSMNLKDLEEAGITEALLASSTGTSQDITGNQFRVVSTPVGGGGTTTSTSSSCLQGLQFTVLVNTQSSASGTSSSNGAQDLSGAGGGLGSETTTKNCHVVTRAASRLLKVEVRPKKQGGGGVGGGGGPLVSKPLAAALLPVALNKRTNPKQLGEGHMPYRYRPIGSQTKSITANVAIPAVASSSSSSSAKATSSSGKASKTPRK